MDIIQNHTRLAHIRALPQNAPKDHPRLRRGDLDRRLDALEPMRRDRVHRGPLNNLEVTESGKVEAKVLEGVGSLVDEEDVCKGG